MSDENVPPPQPFGMDPPKPPDDQDGQQPRAYYAQPRRSRFARSRARVYGSILVLLLMFVVALVLVVMSIERG